MQGRERRNEATEAVQRENEELKEVLSAVQIDLESKTEVSIHQQYCNSIYHHHSCLFLFAGTSAKNNRCHFTRTRN